MKTGYEMVNALRGNAAERVMRFAMLMHDGQYRDGEPYSMPDGGKRKVPYITHPARVVGMLKYWGYTEEKTPVTLAIAWGHDLIEETHINISDIPIWGVERSEFKAIRAGIEMLTFLPPKGISDEAYDRLKAEYVRSIAEDAPLDVLAVKLADRLCNTLEMIETSEKGGCMRAEKYLEKGMPLFKRIDQLPCVEKIKECIAHARDLIANNGMTSEEACDAYDAYSDPDYVNEEVC